MPPDALYLEIWQSTQTPDADRSRLYEEMRVGRVLVPVTERTPLGTPLSDLCVTLLGFSGTAEFAGFTSQDAMRRFFGSECRESVELSIHDLCRLVLLRGLHQLVINPGWELSYLMSLTEVQHVAGLAPSPEPWQQGIPLGGVAHLPHNDSLRDELAREASSPMADKSPLYEAISRACFVVPCIGPVKTDANRNVTGTLSLAPYADDKVRALIGFTDLTAFLARFGHPNVHWVEMPSRSLCYLVRDGGFDGFVVNPDGPSPFWVPATECEALFSGLVSRGNGHYVSPAAEDIHILEAPSSPPVWLLEEFRAGAIRADLAELRWLWFRVGDGYPHLGFAVDPWNDRVVPELGTLTSSLWDRYKEYTPFIDVLPLSLIARCKERAPIVFRRR